MADDLEELLQRLVAKSLRAHINAQEQDPRKFPRACEITDDRALMLLAERDLKFEDAVALQQKLDLLHGEIGVLKERLFLRLHEVYPEVHGSNRVASLTGFRRFDGKWYYVSWDPE